MTGRKCSNCKHYEPAPIWRKGWCRNSMLYSPQQSHLVSEDDLDCERGMGNYWESSTSGAVHSESGAFAVLEQPLQLHYPTNNRREVLTSYTGQPVYSVSGSSGYGNEPPQMGDVPPPQGGGRSGGPTTGRDRQLNYYSDERYWTDYLRIAAPILGVVLMLFLFWFWAQSWFDDDDGGDQTGQTGATATRTFPVIGASPTASVRAAVTGTPQIVLTQPPSIATTPVDPEPAATDTPEVPVTGGGGEIYAGATVQVANTGGTGANLRTDASTDADVVTVLPDGTQLVTTGDPIEAAGFTWWPITSDLGDGYIVADFLSLVE